MQVNSNSGSADHNGNKFNVRLVFVDGNPSVEVEGRTQSSATAEQVSALFDDMKAAALGALAPLNRPQTV